MEALFVVDAVAEDEGTSRLVVQTVQGAAGRERETINVTYTAEADVAEAWLREHALAALEEEAEVKRLGPAADVSDGVVFGLDAEWRPARQKGVRPRVALLQVATQDDCLLVHLSHLESMPPALRTLLASPHALFVGVAVHEDVVRVARDYELPVARDACVMALAKTVGVDGPFGLGALSKSQLGMEWKRRKVTMSNWDAKELSLSQMEYAALDAWAGRELYVRLQDMPNQHAA